MPYSLCLWSLCGMFFVVPSLKHFREATFKLFWLTYIQRRNEIMTDRKKCAEIKDEKFAPGMEDALEQSATKEDKQCDNTTKVTKLSWDEVED